MATLRCAALLTLLAASALSHAQDWRKERTEGLNLELTPYVWAPGVDGKAQIGTRTVRFNQSVSDLIEHVDAGFMGLGIVSYDRLVAYVDYDYISLSADGKIGRDLVIPSGTKATLDTDLQISTFAAGYRFDTFAENTIDVMIGVRTLSLDNELKALGSKLSNNASLEDTIAMLRPSFRITHRWRFNPTLSYGIAGDSNTTYELMPQFQYQFADTFALRFGYKRLFYKQDKHPANTPAFEQLDTSLAGFFLGVGWTFPAHAQKSVAAAPPAPASVSSAKPAPVAPAQCPDGDRDGVCDVDDACPNTPPGTRVGSAGCDCGYVLRTHFAFNSAELTAEDKSALDQLAQTLLDPRLNFVTGEIRGYTDNIGPPAYNVQLSKRRAEAVASYLRSKGVAFDLRFDTQGFGEEHPIADNNTAEGRAQNRRVSVHRTDCGPVHAGAGNPG